MATWLEQSGNCETCLCPSPPTAAPEKYQSWPAHRLEAAFGPGKSLDRGWAASAQAEISALMSVGSQSWNPTKKLVSLPLLAL
jgi:hypothetical protein